MKSKLTQLILAAAITTTLGAGLLAVPAGAAEVKCSILPAQFCKDSTSDSAKKSPVFSVLEWVLAIMTAGIGIAAIGAFVYAGILYSSASGGAEQVKKAKDIITQTVIGLIAFAAMALIIVWLIPGGIF